MMYVGHEWDIAERAMADERMLIETRVCDYLTTQLSMIDAFESAGFGVYDTKIVFMNMVAFAEHALNRKLGVDDDRNVYVKED